MSSPLRVFISHSSDDAELAMAVADRLKRLPGIEVKVDTSGLEVGKPWRRQLHEWMARCGAAVVLLTPAVLKRPQWVLKEAVILGWRLDIEHNFALYFVLAPDVEIQQFSACGFELAQLSETQLLPGKLAELAQADALVGRLSSLLPKAQPPTPFDDLAKEIRNLLRVADPTGATYDGVARHLGLEPSTWGMDRLDRLAEMIACAIVQGRDNSLLDQLIDQVATWPKEYRLKLVNLIAPFWIEAATAGALLRRAPPVASGWAAGQGSGAITIAGARVPEFTAEMAVRRAFGTRLGHFRIATAVGLGGGDLFEDIRAEVCAFARHSRWVLQGLRSDDQVVQKLRESQAPVFVPLGSLPDAATIAQLRAEFPRVLFMAPRPPDRIEVVGDELTPDPDPDRESVEYRCWELAMNAIANG